ncbi:hypothetical protein ACLB2K_006768 [Fragaria x ananassa]
MPPRRRPRVATLSNANEGDEVRGLADSIRDMLRGVLDRVHHPRSVKKKDVFDAGAVEFKGAKGPLDAYSWVDKMERAFESSELPEEKKFKTLFLGQYFNHAHHSRIQSDFLNMKKRDDEGVIEFEQRQMLGRCGTVCGPLRHLPFGGVLPPDNGSGRWIAARPSLFGYP